MAMHRLLWRASMFVVVLVVVACTGTTGTTGAIPTPGPSASPTAAPSATPSASPSTAPNANSAVIRIEQTGGMLPPWEAMRWYPTVALYGDGRLITQGPQVELYPGPALPNLQVTHFSQHAVDQALAWAVEAGLHGEDRFLGPLLLDAGALVFTVVTADGTHHTSVSDLSVNDPAINALRQFQDVMTGLAEWLPDDIASAAAPYPWDRLRVISFPTDPTSLPDPNLAHVVDWPLDRLDSYPVAISAIVAYRCFELQGDDLATVRPIFETANELTLYRSADVDYQFYLHPLLPDDEACPGF